MFDCRMMNEKELPTHICLDELRALLSNLGDEPKHVNSLLRVHHVDHGVDYDEGPSPPDTGAAGTRSEPQSSAPRITVCPPADV